MLPDHVYHAHSYFWLQEAKTGTFEAFVAGHGLAELYSVLTRLPRTPRISPAEALKLIQDNIHSRATVVALSADDYFTLVENLAQLSIAGGAVYAAVIAKAAELANVDHLVTLNVPHFQQVWPSGMSRIVSPVTLRPR